MKRFVLMSAALTLVGSIALADPAPSGASRRRPLQGDACQQMKDTCQAAGYVRGAESGKRLYKDCMLPLMDGKTVSGVDVSTSTVAACRAHGRQAN